MTGFEGKTILLDGAAAGIGKETAITLSQMGAKIVLIDMDEAQLQQTVSELAGEGHGYVVYNLSDLTGIEAMVKTISTQYGPLDGFVHCVGIRCRRPLNMLAPDVVENVMHINYGSFMELTRCICKKGNHRPGLSIVAISSISAKTGGATVTAYAASKAAIDGAVRCLARELAPKQIRLNTIQPGQVNTPAYAAMLENSGGKDPVLERQYLGLCEARDIAETIIFLLSERSKMITGAALPVDGGFFTS